MGGEMDERFDVETQYFTDVRWKEKMEKKKKVIIPKPRNFSAPWRRASDRFQVSGRPAA
jgi:hypothetical protein